MSHGNLNNSFFEPLSNTLTENIPQAWVLQDLTLDLEGPSVRLSAVLLTQIVISFSAAASYVVRVYSKAVFLRKLRGDDSELHRSSSAELC